jgi:SagB-type dehydrogenase family enzyme
MPKLKKTKSKHTKLVNKRTRIPVVFLILIGVTLAIGLILSRYTPQSSIPAPIIELVDATPSSFIALSAPAERGGQPIETVLKNRRTRRSFQDRPLESKQVSQLLWATQGVTVNWGGRTAPTAKSAYPLSVYLLVDDVNGLGSGQYLYHPGDRMPLHQISPILTGDVIPALYQSLSLTSLKNPPILIVITGNFQKMTDVYGGRSRDENVYLEAGHAAQNLALQAESLRLGLVPLTDIDHAKVRDIISIPKDEKIIYLIPIGYPID